MLPSALTPENSAVVTWLSLASQYQGSYTNHETVQGFLGLMTQHSAAFGMLLQGQAARQPVRVR